MTKPFLAFSPEDARLAHEQWGANCGPCALAACLGWPLDQLRPHLREFESRRYMTPSMMQVAITATGHKVYSLPPTSLLPEHGIVRVQFGGPWLAPGVPAKVAYRYTHWIATKDVDGQMWIFDINGMWVYYADWSSDIVPQLTAAIKRADGSISFTHLWEVRRTHLV